MDRFKGKLPKDDLKRFAKEVSKKLVASDFKNGRVHDPTKIDAKKEKQVKAYLKEYFGKAHAKHRERERMRAERKAQHVAAATPKDNDVNGHESGPEDMSMSDEEELDPATVESSTILKRKRDLVSESSHKILCSESPDPTPPPPPPPPPPEIEMPPTESSPKDETSKASSDVPLLSPPQTVSHEQHAAS